MATSFSNQEIPQTGVEPKDRITAQRPESIGQGQSTLIVPPLTPDMLIEQSAHTDSDTSQMTPDFSWPQPRELPLLGLQMPLIPDPKHGIYPTRQEPGIDPASVSRLVYHEWKEILGIKVRERKTYAPVGAGLPALDEGEKHGKSPSTSQPWRGDEPALIYLREREELVWPLVEKFFPGQTKEDIQAVLGQMGIDPPDFLQSLYGNPAVQTSNTGFNILDILGTVRGENPPVIPADCISEPHPES